MCLRGRFDLRGQIAEGVEKGPMRRAVEQGPLVMLAVNLDDGVAERPQGLHADGLIIDQGAGAPVGILDAAQNQSVPRFDIRLLREAKRRMVTREIEGRGPLPLLGAMAHERTIAARAERKRESVKQDGFSG